MNIYLMCGPHTAWLRSNQVHLEYHDSSDRGSSYYILQQFRLGLESETFLCFLLSNAPCQAHPFDSCVRSSPPSLIPCLYQSGSVEYSSCSTAKHCPVATPSQSRVLYSTRSFIRRVLDQEQPSPTHVQVTLLYPTAYAHTHACQEPET